MPLTSQVAAVTVADVAAQIDARGSVSIAADRAGNNAIAQGKKGVFAVAAPNPLQRKIDSVKRGLTLLQSAFDVPNVNELDEHDRVRLRQAFVEATEVYAHDALILRTYDRANDEYDCAHQPRYKRQNYAEYDADGSSATTHVGSADSVSAATEVFAITWLR